MNTKRPLIKPLVAAVAATSILFGVGAFAEYAVKTDKSAVTAAGIVDYEADNTLDLDGTNVVNANGETIGDIDRIVQSDTGKMAVIGLSLSLKEVAVPLGDLRWENNKLVINATKDELESQRDIDMNDFEDLEPGQYSRKDIAGYPAMDGNAMAGNMASDSTSTDSRSMTDSADTDRAETIDIEGNTVVNANGEEIGDIDRVVQSDRGKMAVIGLSGSLKEVAVPLSDLSWENDQVVVSSSKSELESQQDIDMTDFEELEPGQYSRHEFSRFEKIAPKQ